MHPSERRATFALSLIVSLRMLGLMMVLPLFVLEAGQYQGATASLVGLAFGAYNTGSPCVNRYAREILNCNYNWIKNK